MFGRFVPGLAWGLLISTVATAQPPPKASGLPFEPKIQVYRDKDGKEVVFKLRLEQPFLAEEFEKGNFLRLRALDRNAHLIYPMETKFKDKQAEFLGRLRGAGVARLSLGYEIVTENLDGSKKVDLREGEVKVEIPTTATGSASLFKEWATQQSAHFQRLLRYYPNDSFLQYCVLQSADRYGIPPANLPAPRLKPGELENDIYSLFSSGAGFQEAMQREAIGGRRSAEEPNIHVSQLTPPSVPALNFEKMLEERVAKDKALPTPHEAAKLTPRDQYLLHFHSMGAAGELFDLAYDWGTSVVSVFRIRSVEHGLQKKLEEQLGLTRTELSRLCSAGVVGDVAFTGSDPFLVEGTDVTLLLHVKQKEPFAKSVAESAADAAKRHPNLVARDFNYRGQRVVVRYTDDRVVSSFSAQLGDWAVHSNSHRAVRKIIDVFAGKAPRLFDAVDYRYVTSVLPPSAAAKEGYFFASEDFLRRQISPELKIAERRRIDAFNHLVMLNNAGMFFRLENGRSPNSLAELVDDRYIGQAALAHPSGNTYALDPSRGAFMSSLYNRLKHLTPNVELPVLTVTRGEQQEYERYRRDFEANWKHLFAPIGVRIHVGAKTKFETCMLPVENGVYARLRGMLDERAQPMGTGPRAASTVASLEMAPGRKQTADLLRFLPGVAEALQADPTLTDLNWLGDRVSIAFCDGTSIVEVDPTMIRGVDLFGGLRVGATEQSIGALATAAVSLPAYVAFDLEDRDKATRFLKLLAGEIYLHDGAVLTLPTALDAYRMPDYRGRTPYVLSHQIHAIKIRLHVAVVGNRLVAATNAEALRQVIDADAAMPSPPSAGTAQARLHVDFREMKRLRAPLDLYWAEKARLASHRNVMPIYNLMKIFDVPITQIPRLSESNVGVVYVCPDGTYTYDPKSDQVLSTAFGNRQDSRQNERLDPRSSFSRFFGSMEEISAAVRFDGQVMFATLEITRKPAAPPVANQKR